MREQQYQQPQEQNQKVNHGNPPDDDLINGPKVNRGCTDILCLLIYIIATGLMLAIAVLGYRNGQPVHLTYPFDPDGRACGYDIEVKQYPYIYLVSPYVDHFNRSLCLSECPNWSENSTQPTKLSCKPNSVVKDCNARVALGPDEVNMSMTDNVLEYLNGSQQVNLDTLMNYSTFIYNTTVFMDRICIPDGRIYVKMISNMTSNLDISFTQYWIQDIITVWKVILASAGMAILIGLVYMILMRFCSGILTWLGILLFFIAVALLIIFVQNESKGQQLQADINKGNGVSDDNNTAQRTANSLKYLSYALMAFISLAFLAFICYFNKIRLAIAIIKSASLYLIDEPWALLVPPFFAVLTMGFWAFWVSAFVYIYSMGEIKGSNDSPFATVKWNEETRRMLWYFLFMGFWENALLNALCSFILASSCCIWYFSQGAGQNFFQFPILISIRRGLFSHLGSLACGSFILACVQLVRFWLEYINQQMNMMAPGERPQPLKCFIDCLRCYASCFERFISFLNKNAYIQIALTGKSFFPAAKDAWYLISTNVAKFGIVGGIGNIFSTIGKFFIAFVTTFLCYLIITRTDAYKDKIHSPFLPSFFFFVVAYGIGSLFMLVYSMSIDAILQCSIVDEEINKKTNQPPKYCPQPLKDFYNSR